MDSQGNVWITETGLNIYTNSRKVFHPVVVGELWPDTDPNDRLPISIAEDGRGRLWFWSSCLLGDDRRGAIRGVLIRDGDTITSRPALDGIKPGRISVVAPLDKTNLWLAVRNAGIFSVDLETLRGTSVAGPEPGAFNSVQQIFKDGDDVYVIAGSAGELTPLRTQQHALAATPRRVEKTARGTRQRRWQRTICRPPPAVHDRRSLARRVRDGRLVCAARRRRAAPDLVAGQLPVRHHPSLAATQGRTPARHPVRAWRNGRRSRVAHVARRPGARGKS